ncbi:NAD kinase [Chengkuizengella axinellae]|uniref:NAD kinase n=1 Tax=Chengkuizengella axinellae TaxID=3064388 RepID=A0ABT9ITC5_9BACL|nr:NAD kinase [Chengkuizengella sp. 2205SS18-9]MDP5272527.1 NAD kinase [Chengkuizengella sp. 2205SS18-9]
MKYFVLNRGDETSLKLSHKFHKLANQYNMILDEKSPDIAVSIGGDGTMLYAFHKFVQNLDHISFVGIHTGHLGFYADWKPNEIEQLLSLMVEKGNSEQIIVEYPIVQLEIKTIKDTRIYYALNEITIKGIHATLVAQLDINDDQFEMFRGDGICISTPSGSTAYNKGLGGGIIHPALPSIQITEIASINNRVFRTLGSPIILPKHHHCDIYPKAKQKILLSVDHLQFEHDDIISIRSSVSHKKVRFARYRPFPFWNRVKDAFVGNESN